MATTKPAPKHTDIPRIVYDNLRAVHESRVRRLLDADDRLDFDVVEISDVEIFRMMPDHQYLIWDESCQPTITDVTLSRMMATVEFPQ
jgi:hypothetical protein